MFEDKTAERILAETLATGAELGVDTRPGSVFYDAVAGVCSKIANYYADLSNTFDLVFLTTAVDEYLDMRGAEYVVYRHYAKSAKYRYVFEGVQPADGERFFCDGKYFQLKSDADGPYLEAEDVGENTNGIPSGAIAVPVNSISGLTSSLFGEVIEPGTDTEDDESYRQRIREKVAGPAENGNRQHYKTWCEDVSGVGRARIVPLWDGPNTVKGVIIGTDGHPAAPTLVAQVQEYVDPNGAGLGEGVANLGAHFTAASATTVEVSIAFKALLSSDATLEDATLETSEAIQAHLKDLALNTQEDVPVVVRVSTVGAIIHACPSILDYSELTLNGGTRNIDLKATEVGVLGEVVISAAVR